MLEVEEKFSFSDRSALEDRLRLQGFSPFQEITMVDWYFDRVDLDDCDNGKSSSSQELPLVKKDHWLRYRQITSKNGVEWTKDGEWQLKRGNPGQKSGGAATVYEEIEGPEAVQIAKAVVAQDQSDVQESKASSSLSSPRIFDGHSVPVLPLEGGCDLVPFARIVTQRAQWKPQQKDANNNTMSSFSHLVVDLDTTPDGFAVGEVEALVEDADQVEQARTKIREFVSRILDESRADAPPMGKLEQFLYRKQPRIYELCVESGVVPRRSIPNETATSDC